ncbi:hypothetical protein ACJA25_01975 [Mycoplasmopsis hyopharyngis]|uniref:hypothetical protein n=1 Tax=Mycoplasmopsis hyopharyngis TaxID=29558 RepID=UPI003873586B
MKKIRTRHLGIYSLSLIVSATSIPFISSSCESKKKFLEYEQIVEIIKSKNIEEQKIDDSKNPELKIYKNEFLYFEKVVSHIWNNGPKKYKISNFWQKDFYIQWINNFKNSLKKFENWKEKILTNQTIEASEKYEEGFWKKVLVERFKVKE